MTIAGSDFDFLRHLLRERTGICITSRDLPRIQARLAPVAKAAGITSVEALVARLRLGSWSAVHVQAVESVVASASPFLLDGRVGELLSTTILPHLIQHRRQTRSLRFWCPACGTGQEPYSIAVMIKDRFPELADWDISILATDSDPHSVLRAREGIYSAIEAMDGMPAPMLVKHFERRGNQWQIKAHVREAVTLSVLNLRDTWEIQSTMDAIFMRRVLVYFSAHVRKPLLARLRSALAADGVLYLGSTDAESLLDERFERMQDEKSGFYRPLV